MKIILTQEVSGLGAPGDVVEVKDGYGRNYLLPRGDAIRWTRGAESTAESIKTARASRAVRDADHAAEIKTKLEADPVPVKVKAGDSRPPVRRRHRRRHRRPRWPRRRASPSTSAPSLVGNPIKSLGTHEVSVKLHDEVSATVALNVIPA